MIKDSQIKIFQKMNGKCDIMGVVRTLNPQIQVTEGKSPKKEKKNEVV